jgi:hypothetical protein
MGEEKVGSCFMYAVDFLGVCSFLTLADFVGASLSARLRFEGDGFLSVAP